MINTGKASDDSFGNIKKHRLTCKGNLFFVIFLKACSGKKYLGQSRFYRKMIRILNLRTGN